MPRQTHASAPLPLAGDPERRMARPAPPRATPTPRRPRAPAADSRASAMNSRNSALVTLCASMSKRGNVDGERVELVVPAKRDDRADRRAVRPRRRTPRAERGAAGGDIDALIRRRSGAELVRQVVRLALVRVRQPLPHVEQRFLVHRLVFERGEDGLPVGHRGMLASGEVELGPLHRRDDRVVGSPRELEDLVARRPARAGAAARHGLLLAVGIDAAREQRLEALVDAGAARARASETR